MPASVHLIVCCVAGLSLAAPHGNKMRDDLPLPFQSLPLVTPTVTIQPTATSTVFRTVTEMMTVPPVVVIVTSTLQMPTPTSLVSLPSSQTVGSSSAASSGTSSATPLPVPANGTDRAPLTNPIVATYYPDWAFESMAPEQVDFARFDWVDFAFAVPTSSFGLEWTQDNSAALLNRLVSLAHAANKRVKLSVGGWSGSKFFSPAVATPASRATFVKNIVAMYGQFDLDGIDIDWEYPGVSGASGNIVSPHDSANYLLFLTLLRSSLPPSALITAAVATTPFASSSPPTPLASVAPFSAVLDYILLMNYDVWGASDTNPGPNAPLSNACGNSTQPDATVVGAVRSWTTAGFDKSKILLGVPSYGYVQNSEATSLRQRRADIVPILAPEADSTVISATSAAPLLSGTVSAPMILAAPAANHRLTGIEGNQIQFIDLVTQGVIQLAESTGSPALSPASTLPVDGASDWAGAKGFQRYWDACSSTPFLMSLSQDQLVTYDDPTSLSLKASLSKALGIAGVNMFDVHGDTADYVLTDALRSGLGLPSVSIKPSIDAFVGGFFDGR